MPLPAGTRFGPYEILAPIGAGGMGEVYRARDTRLNRDVALKVLPEDLARDSGRRQRFEQEARSVAALNHPNIVAIYDVGENFFVSELVDGESLRAAGAMPARRAIDLAAQIADGLASAHAHGVTHRDLKPENIMVTRDGRAKILDFGLAKVARAAIGEDAVTHTQEGVVVGTVGYMSPEQVRGQMADARSDIFSFGLVLYEMLAGKRAFTGVSSIDVMSAILKEDPASLPVTTSPGLKLIVEHCLEKMPDRRFQSARDLAFALQALSGSTAVTPVNESRHRVPKRWAALAGIALLGALGGAFWFGRGLSTPPVAHPADTARSATVAPAHADPVSPAEPVDPVKAAAPKPGPEKLALAGHVQPPAAVLSPKLNEKAVPKAVQNHAPPSAPISADAAAAYRQAMQLLDEDKATEAVRRFDDAIRASPDYLEAYAGRALARRSLRQIELSLEDCDKIVKLNADDPRGYNCRGFGHNLLRQFESAVNDFNQAIRLNPNFTMAFEHRANAYTALEQYEKAAQDYAQVIRLRPRNAEAYIRRAAVYTNLKQFDKAIQDYTEAIRFQPDSIRAYNGRASVEDILGDAAGAAADRRRARQSRKK